MIAPSFRGSQAMQRLLTYTDVKEILDIGSGTGEQAEYMRHNNRRVTTVSMIPPANYLGDYLEINFNRYFDAIWASHVLEHQPNVNLFLQKCFMDLREDGLLAITVPPAKPEIVGGHLTTWNAGLLLYNLILAGFDCREARVSECYASAAQYPPYNISVIVRKKPVKLPQLVFDNGDLERLAPFFPCAITQGFDGRLPSIRW
jgi:SAM-dependent methyltransferase